MEGKKERKMIGGFILLQQMERLSTLKAVANNAPAGPI